MGIDLSEFKSNGYMVIPSVFSIAEVRRMEEAFTELEAKAREFSSQTESEGSVFFVEDERIDRVCWCGASVPHFLDIGRDDRLLAIVKAVLGTTACDHLINQAHFKLPEDGVDFPWHQDSQHRRYGTDLWTDVNGEGSFLQIFLAVDAATEENGCLYVFPESHRKGHLGLSDKKLDEVGIDEKDALPVLLNPGDIAFFGPYLIHGSSANDSDSPRRALINGYSCPGANRRVYPGEGAGELIQLP